MQFPSSGNPLPDFPPSLQPAIKKMAQKAAKTDRFFIFIILKGIGQKNFFDNISLQV